MLVEIADLRVASALDDATLVREAKDTVAMIVRAPIPVAIFAGAPTLLAAIRHGAGLDMVPMEAATEAGVLVANVPAVNAPTVAEHVFMVSLALLRRFRQADRDLRGSGWNVGRDHAYQANDLGSRTIGIIGFGNIGAAIAKIALNGFGMAVLAHSRSQKQVEGVSFVELDQLLSEADVVVLCCPLTAETRGLIDAARIARMKPSAILVNVARGPIIVDEALIAALSQNRIAGAALDVFAEQPLPADNPYFSFDNVIITPHMAGVTEESMMRMGIGAVEETLRVLRGELPKNLRNPEVLKQANLRVRL